MNPVEINIDNLKLTSLSSEDNSLKNIGYDKEDLDQMSETRSYPSKMPEKISFKIEKGSEIIGEVTFSRLRWFNRKSELSLILKKKHQGKGYAKNILKTIISFAFNRMNLHRLEAEVIETNSRSHKIIKDLGFVYEGELREAKYQNGKYVSVLRYGLLKNEFAKTNT